MRPQIVLRLDGHKVTPNDVIGAAKVGGCTCDPWVQMPSRAHRRQAKRAGTPVTARLLHDPGCPRLESLTRREGRP